MIDNYDSFTYNLVQYVGELGADVHVHRNDAITLEEFAAWKPEAIVISPGPCTPTKPASAFRLCDLLMPWTAFGPAPAIAAAGKRPQRFQDTGPGNSTIAPRPLIVVNFTLAHFAKQPAG